MFVFTVYKPEENLDYLDDWLNHHTKIGITHFYMYDNAGGSGNWGMLKEKIDPRYNKNGYRHRYTIEEARERQQDIFKKYNVTHVIWDPRDANGNILYRWNHAAVDFNSHVKSGLCAFVDVDEFIIKREEFAVSRLTGVTYKAMHEYQSVYDCHDKCIIPHGNTKCILDLSSFHKMPRMEDRAFDMHFLEIDLPISKNYYNHYNYTKLRHRKFNWPGYEKTSFEKCFVYEPDPGLIK